jgi:hypothetical protein
MAVLNYLGEGFVFLLLIGVSVFIGYNSRKGIVKGIKNWHDSMKIKKEASTQSEKQVNNQEEKD